MHPNRWMTIIAFDKYYKLEGQNHTVDLFKYCYSLSSSLDAKKGMKWFYIFSKRSTQNPLKDIFQGKSLLIKNWRSDWVIVL